MTGAILERAELRGAVLYDADRDRHAQLRDSNLSWAQLQGANLFQAQLQGANLSWAQLQGANLSEAQLQGANLSWAQLQGANLFQAQLQGAVLGMAQLQGANLTWARLQGTAFGGFQYPSRDRSSGDLRETPLSVSIQVREEGAQLQGAVLWGAELQGTDLGFAQLQGADLRRSNIWRAWAGSDRRWDLADLRGSIVAPMTTSQVDSLISEATKSISNEELRKSVAERMGEALRNPGVPARPNFPKTWQSEPNVMFDENDPAPEPFGWGRRRWTTEESYDEQLAKFLGALACDPNAPVARTLGLARRARGDYYLGGGPERLWAKSFAAHLTGPGCPPASALPEDLRHELEQLAARDDDISVVAPETSPP